MPYSKDIELCDLEHFLLCNDFTEDVKEVDYINLEENPLFVNNQFHSNRNFLSDVENFIIQNNFVENSSSIDYHNLEENPLFFPAENLQNVSLLSHFLSCMSVWYNNNVIIEKYIIHSSFILLLPIIFF